jgi:cytochrome c551/c552
MSSAAAETGFQTSDRCVACHNDLHSVGGENVSIGLDWRVSLMANASRDPYWQASVRRETMEHFASVPAIEDECSACHMPIPRYAAKVNGRLGSIFAHLPLNRAQDKQASDGVSCSVCHQIASEGLGNAASYNGEFLIGKADTDGVHAEFGPFEIDSGLMQVMRTSTGGFEPRRGDHVRTSELCASCHTLITKALDSNGQVIGSLPEQMPYQEWLHSDFRQKQTCQACHMPQVDTVAPIARVLGVDRSGIARHEFVAANFLMQRVFAQHRDDFDSPASADEFSTAAEGTVRYLQSHAAQLTVAKPILREGRLEADVMVRNLGGHKLPTAFPSRRAWLHLVVRDATHRVIFESGALNQDGSIQGNDNDLDPTRFEPHYEQIRSSDQVQIYESILHGASGDVTTGLLSATGYLKDNRLLPQGFDKATAAPEIAVHGDARTDVGFSDMGHRVRYSVDVGSSVGPFEVRGELWYQPIGYRWAQNLKTYKVDEVRDFNRYFDEAGAGSAVMLVGADAQSN